MKFKHDTAEIYIPDGIPEDEALTRTTHLCFAAHQDDIEIMAAGPILECFQRDDQWFTGVVVTDGRGSPRNGLYEKYTDEEMRRVRFIEQRKAAYVGEYSAQVMLDYASKVVKDGGNRSPVEDMVVLLKATRPQVIFTHNLADKHETHVAVAVRVITALRALPEDDRPQKVYGCEVWRDLDWMLDEDKITFDLSEKENLQAALLGVFDSQISGGKRYDLASLARRRANATYFASHDVDDATGRSYAMNLTPLVTNPDLDIQEYMQSYIDRFAVEVKKTLTRIL
jgi:LmbE family N-acetylglucosaminyl deacetylase